MPLAVNVRCWVSGLAAKSTVSIFWLLASYADIAWPAIETCHR